MSYSYPISIGLDMDKEIAVERRVWEYQYRMLVPYAFSVDPSLLDIGFG